MLSLWADLYGQAPGYYAVALCVRDPYMNEPNEHASLRGKEGKAFIWGAFSCPDMAEPGSAHARISSLVGCTGHGTRLSTCKRARAARLWRNIKLTCICRTRLAWAQRLHVHVQKLHHRTSIQASNHRSSSTCRTEPINQTWSSCTCGACIAVAWLPHASQAWLRCQPNTLLVSLS